ncbi:hypothetical protein JCM17380_40860 [Desulfosporosinus burensis]
MRSKQMLSGFVTGSVALVGALVLSMFPRQKKKPMLMRRGMNVLTKGSRMLLKKTKLFH